MTDLKFIEKANEMIGEFRLKFKDEFGVLPYVYFDLSTKKLKKAHLHEIEGFMNQLILERFDDTYPDGIRQKTRRRELLDYRQIAQYMCYTLSGYGLLHLKRYFGWDHATIIHSNKVVANFLMVNDKVFLDLYQPIIQRFNETFRDDDDVPDVGRSKNHT